MAQGKKRALVLGGGPWQVPIIRFLQNKNLHVTVVEPLAVCPGGQAADLHSRVDARDSEAILKAHGHEHFELVTSDQSDVTVEAVAIVAEKLKLRGNPVAAAQNFADKTRCRELAGRLGISQPQFVAAKSLSEARAFITSRPGACIIKPADSQSSRGVLRIEGPDDPALSRAVTEALSFSPRKKMIVEDFVVGKEITVEGLCSGGRHRCLAMSIKDHFRTAIANKLRYPADLPTRLEEAVFEAMDGFVENSGLKFGITHAEFLVDIENEKFWLVEIACRGGGTLISSDIAPWVSGVGFYDVLYADLNGTSTDVCGLSRQSKGALLGFFEFPEGQVKQIHALATVRDMPGVHHLHLDFKIGDTLRKATDDRSRQGFAILFGADAFTVEALWEKVRREVRVEFV